MTSKPRSGPFAIVPATAVFDKRLSNADVRILAALGCFANRDGRCWPSEPMLADLTAISERHIRDRLHVLEDTEHVQIERRPGLNSIYRLPRNYSAGVREPDPGTTVPHPRNYSAGDPGTTVPPNNTNNKTKNTIGGAEVKGDTPPGSLLQPAGQLQQRLLEADRSVDPDLTGCSGARDEERKNEACGDQECSPARQCC